MTGVPHMGWVVCSCEQTPVLDSTETTLRSEMLNMGAVLLLLIGVADGEIFMAL